MPGPEGPPAADFKGGHGIMRRFQATGESGTRAWSQIRRGYSRLRYGQVERSRPVPCVKETAP